MPTLAWAWEPRLALISFDSSNGKLDGEWYNNFCMGITLPQSLLRDFCQRWHIRELSLFGSVLREDFRPDSDVDVMVDFAPTFHPSLFDIGRMQMELEKLFGRSVDLLTRKGVEASRNPYRKQSILSSAQVVYAG
jgi:uncharacterized protein